MSNADGGGGAVKPKLDFLTSRGYCGFESIDSGGQGNVYKTRKDGRLFAVKVLHVEQKNNAEAKMDADLMRELNILKGIRHPNCVRMIESFRTRSKVYIVMPFLSGGTLGSVVWKYGPLCEWNVKIWFPPIALAVRYLHRNKVAHRDLKLDNILLDEYHNPYVADYGFSRFVERPTGGVFLSDTYCGTRSYQPPQILHSIPYDPFKADIWSLGIIFFNMLNKINPFNQKLDDKKLYAAMISKNYRLSPKVESNTSSAAKELISITIEADETKRVDIETLCIHPWMPLIFGEAKMVIEQMKTAHKEEKTPKETVKAMPQDQQDQGKSQ